MQIEGWQEIVNTYNADEFKYTVRDKEYAVGLNTVSLSGTKIKKVYLPTVTNYGDILKFIREENIPGSFPYTAGVFPFKRTDEDPKRQFAGEGGPLRTNQRFHYLTQNDAAKGFPRLLTGVTLYGEDPAERPDIYGK